MRWRRGDISPDIEDERGQGSGGGGLRIGGLHVGLGGLAVLIVLSLVTGRNFLALLEPGGVVSDSNESRPYQPAPGEQEQVEFVSFVLDDAQDTWTRMLPASGVPYRRAKLVLFTDSVESGCGIGGSAMGPFY